MSLEFSSLMSRIFELIVINTCFDGSLACRSQSHKEGVSKKKVRSSRTITKLRLPSRGG